MSDLPRLVVLASGRGSNYLALEEAVAQGRLPAVIAAVISDRAHAAVLDHARQRGVDTICLEPAKFPSRHRFEQALAVAIDGFQPACVILAGFMRLLGAELVDHYAGRMLNIHPSLLPRHRGLDTHRRAIETGEREHGASVHFVTPALDAGPVISQVRIEIQPGDTPDTLADRLLPLEHRLYPATVALLLRTPVEIRDERIYIENQPLDQPLLLGRDLGDDGRLLAGDGRAG